jgi:cytochrome c-type biogenesis protein CcmH
MELVQRALQLNPRLPKALAMAGAAEFKQGRADAAKEYWTRLLAVIPPDSTEAGELRQMIARLDNRKGAADANRASAPERAKSAATGAADKPMASRRRGQGPLRHSAHRARTCDTGAARRYVVHLRPRGTGTHACRWRSCGKKSGDLPFRFRLDDSQAMAGGPSLSTIDQLRVEGAHFEVRTGGSAARRPARRERNRGAGNVESGRRDRPGRGADSEAHTPRSLRRASIL